jgi:hypothetical protein
MTRPFAAPARPAPASYQAVCCEPNASGEMIHRGQPRPHRVSFAREPTSHKAMHSRPKPIGACCGAVATPLAGGLNYPLLEVFEPSIVAKHELATEMRTPTQASMPTRHAGMLADHACTWPRDHFCCSTMAPAN